MSKRSKLKIAFFPSDPYGCGYYRMMLPASKLKSMGHEVKICMNDYNKVVPYEKSKNKDKFPVYDVYHFQRVTTPSGFEAIREASKLGVVLMDMDDDLFNLYPGHPSSWYFRKGKECLMCHNTRIGVTETKCANCGSTLLEYQDRLKCCRDSFEYLDCLTVSTRSLYDKYSHTVKRCEIVPNYINFEVYDNLNKKNDENYLAVGWAGSNTHVADLDLLNIGVGLSVIKEFEKVYFVSCGESKLGEKFGKKLTDRLVLLNPVHIMQYPSLVKNFDIGLAPIIENSFNDSKSALKAIEYGACGIPVIASKSGPYKDYVRDGETGFLIKPGKDWAPTIRKLLKDRDLRVRMGEANYKQARTMDINRRISDRENLYYELLEKRVKT